MLDMHFTNKTSSPTELKWLDDDDDNEIQNADGDDNNDDWGSTVVIG